MRLFWYNVFMTIKELVNFGHRELIQFDSARLDSELLLADILKKPITYVLAHSEKEMGFFQEWRYKYLISKRKKGVPMAYFLGYKEFYGLDFQVNKHVLVPRPNTEDLVEAVINYIQPDYLLLDVGTGSGCIPISVLKHVEGLQAIATDLSASALRVARANAVKHGIESRIQFFQSDLLKGVPPEDFEGKGLVVTANLPYVPLDYQVNVETKFEPQMALWGGEDGMELYRRLLDQLLPLKPRAMFFECFDFQKAILAQHAPFYEFKKASRISGEAGVVILEKKRSL